MSLLSWIVRPAEPPPVDPRDREETLSLTTALALTQEIGEVIRHADTKASLVLTAQAALFVPMVSFLGSTPDADGLQGVVVVAGRVVPVLLAVAVAVLLIAVLAPRVQGAPAGNRFAWPRLRTMSDAELATPPVPLEAWQHARVLSGICHRKFVLVRWGLILAALELAVVVADAVATRLF